MFDRRQFLGSLAGLALTGSLPATAPAGPSWEADPASRQYLADLAACNLKVLGIPRRPALVAEGFHPLTPARVIVVDGAERQRYGRRHPGLRRRVRREAARWAHCWPNPAVLPSAKQELCIGLMDRMTAYYRRPDLLEPWARTLWRRELLASTGVGHGFGLLHDFQLHDPPVRIANGLVDWWLILLPDGIDWQALDGEPVYFMIGAVLEDRKPGPYLRVLEAIARSLWPVVLEEQFNPAAWADHLAGQSPAAAARALNGLIARGLRQRP